MFRSRSAWPLNKYLQYVMPLWSMSAHSLRRRTTIQMNMAWANMESSAIRKLVRGYPRYLSVSLIVSSVWSGVYRHSSVERKDVHYYGRKGEGLKRSSCARKHGQDSGLIGRRIQEFRSVIHLKDIWPLHIRTYCIEVALVWSVMIVPMLQSPSHNVMLLTVPSAGHNPP